MRYADWLAKALHHGRSLLSLPYEHFWLCVTPCDNMACLLVHRLQLQIISQRMSNPAADAPGFYTNARSACVDVVETVQGVGPPELCDSE
jgi:hypothetical protein